MGNRTHDLGPKTTVTVNSANGLFEFLFIDILFILAVDRASHDFSDSSRAKYQ